MKLTSVLVFLLLFSSSLLSAQPDSSLSNKRPNIVLFLVDDMGWSDDLLEVERRGGAAVRDRQQVFSSELSAIRWSEVPALPTRRSRR